MKNIKLRTLALCLALVMVMASVALVNAFAAGAPSCAQCNYVNGFCTECDEFEPAALSTGKYDLNGDEVMDEVYEIGNAGQLYWFADYVNSGHYSANAVLTADITVNKNVLVDGALNPDSAVVAAFRTWTPIGGESIPYTGTFDGQNYTISGLYFNDVEASNVGLFGYMGETALVKNVTLARSYFRGLEFISGIVVYNRGTMDGCINEAYIQAICYEDYETWEIMGGDSGGVAYYNYGTMTNCHNRGQVRGAWAGGVVNENEGTVNACSNEGYVASGHPWDSDYLGGVVVFNRTGGIVTNCYNTGTVYGSVGGGVVGYNRGTVRNCYNTGVSDCWAAGGGVVGWNYGTVEKCYNAGVSDGYYDLGGVVGINSGTVKNCYNTGAVSGGRFVGGVVGSNYKSGDYYGVIENCYNMGTVTCEDYSFGGVIGENDSGCTVTNCYYLDVVGDYTNPGGINGVDVAGQAEVMTLEQFKSGEVTYLLNGDQSEIVFGQLIGTEPYPVFRTENDDRTVYACTNCAGAAAYTNDPAKEGGVLDHNFVDGTCTICGASNGPRMEDGYYIITNVEELYWFANYVNGGKASAKAKLGADIDVNPGYTFHADGTYTQNETAGELNIWTPIGNGYQGTFDGRYNGVNHTISGLYFNNSSVSNVGLFSFTGSDAVVQNVSIENSYFYGKSYVGGIVGHSKGNVLNCINNGTVSGNSSVGGIVGYAGGKVSDCINNGAVNGNDSVGGIAGDNRNNVSNCYNAGAVSGNNYVGGIAGYSQSDIVGCMNEGAVSGLGEFVGGIVGEFAGGEVSDCYNAGAVSGLGEFVGGIAGVLADGNVSNCYNEGVVSGSGYFVGGIAGAYDSSAVSNCYYLNQVGDVTNPGGINGADIEGRAEAKTLEQFKSGEVAYLLGNAFGQTIGTDDYPVFFAEGNQVYEYDACPNAKSYANAPAPENNTEHTYEDGACIYCGLLYTIDLSEAVITVENAFYTGEAVTPAVVVTIGGQTLVEGVDYTVTYENNIKVGTEAKVIITAVEGSAYTGTAEANFNILNCLTDFHTLIEALEARLAELERQAEENTAVQEAIAEIRAEIEEILQNYATNADLEAALVRIAALESQVSDLETRMAAVEAEITRLTGILNALQTALETLQNTYGIEIPALQEAVADLQDAIDNLDGTYATDAELEEAIAGVNGRIDALQQQIAALAETYATKTEVQGYIAALQALIDANSGNIDAINALLEAINAELATLKNAEGEYRLDVIEEILKKLLETTIPGINALIKENAESIGINAEAIAALNETVSEIQDTLEDLTAEDARLAELIAGLETRLNDLQTSLEAALEALKEELLEELDKAKEELEEALEDLKNANDEKAKALEEAIRALETLIEETEAALKTYTDEAMEKAVTAAQESLDAAIVAVEQKLEETREDLMQAINSGNADLAQRIEKVRTSLNAAIAANNATKIELTEQIRQTEAVLQVAIEKVSADLALAKQELIDAIIAGDTDLDEKFAALQSAMDAAMAASAVADDALKLQLNQAVETMNMAVQQVQKNLDEAKDELAKKDEKLNAMVVTAIVIASVGMAGCAGLAAFIIIDKRKLIK